MTLDCKTADRIRQEFGTLWRCSKLGNTLEISTPYAMPDSTLFTLFLTTRGDRIIACDGGRIAELLTEFCDLPPDEWRMELDALAETHGLKVGSDHGTPVYFKECRDKKLIGSIAFDVANFALMAANVILAQALAAEETEKEKRFVTEARAFIAGIKAHDQILQANFVLDDVPGVKFSVAVISSSRLWLVSCVSGSSLLAFRRNASDAALNMKDAWESRLRPHIVRMIPLLNNEAHGYEPRFLRTRIAELKKDARQEPVLWTERDRLAELLAAA